MARHELTGLDPSNPLGFLAALGLLKVLSWDASAKDTLPSLHFAGPGIGTPVLETPLSFDQVGDAVLADAAAQGNCPALQLAYGEDGRQVPHTAPEAIRDLKPAPAEAREFLERMSRSDRRSAGMAASFFSEFAHDNNGRTKPTALHFTTGNQVFLRMVDQLRRGIGKVDIDEALLGPWSGTSDLPSLSWDSAATRYYALRANNPSPEKRGSVPVANWLALQSLSFLPVAARCGLLATTGVDGSWKQSTFVWPLWMDALPARVIASLLRMPLRGMTARTRHHLGIAFVLCSAIHRRDPGGDGSFSPADVVPPAAGPT